MNTTEIALQQRQRLADYTGVIGMGIQFAFQPVVDLRRGRVMGYEALLRGRSGEPAASIIENVLTENRAFFDQACRSRAIAEAADLAVTGDLFLNCTETRPDNLDLAINATRDEASKRGLAARQIVLEFASLRQLGSPRELAEVRERAHKEGFRVLADNFGTGEAGLKRLAVFRPDLVKLDREIINNIHTSRRRQAIVLGVVATCRALGTRVVATGVERQEEVRWLFDQAGIGSFQGYYFARPQLAAKPPVDAAKLESGGV